MNEEVFPLTPPELVDMDNCGGRGAENEVRA